MPWYQNALVIVLVSGGMLYIAYKTYGRFLARRVLNLRRDRVTPAVALEDGVDFVPTRRVILFGHHFASIAGLAPIVGPAIAVVWGWLPALLWVVLGSIFVGAVHDMSTLVASIRHKAATIGDVTRAVIGPRAQILFLILIFFLLALAMGVFALLMARLFTNESPEAVVPTFSLIGVAILIGALVYRVKWNLTYVTIGGLVTMFALLYVGVRVPVPAYRLFVTDDYARREIRAHPELTKGQAAVDHLNTQARDAPPAQAAKAKDAAENVARAVATTRSGWTYLLLVYAFVASVLPVWLLLQPRDYINSYLLFAGLLAMVVGFAFLRPALQAPAWNSQAIVQGQSCLPFLFLTIACGAVSGFHSLVSSGTTARQIRREPDAHPIGYGGMLMEAFLAVLVIAACASALPADQYDKLYRSGPVVNNPPGLGGFLVAAGNVVADPVTRMTSPDLHAGIRNFCTVFVAVVVVSFAMTTLDTGTRLLRYDVEALGRLLPGRAVRRGLANRYFSSLVAVAAIGFIALLKLPDAKGRMQPAGITLWTLFGTSNQLLATLGLLIVTVYLWVRRKPFIFTLLPMLGMLAMVTWAMITKIRGFHRSYLRFGDSNNLTLLILSIIILCIAVWLLAEAVIAFTRPRPAAPTPDDAETQEHA